MICSARPHQLMITTRPTEQFCTRNYKAMMLTEQRRLAICTRMYRNADQIQHESENLFSFPIKFFIQKNLLYVYLYSICINDSDFYQNFLDANRYSLLAVFIISKVPVSEVMRKWDFCC